MSNYLAVATVTAALSQTIRTAISADVTGATVTVARPHSSVGGQTPESPTVNLYLFQVVPNKTLRNQALPTRSSSGEVSHQSQVALDLNYLVTFYGDESELVPQRLLGSVMRTLNSRPILTQEAIRATVTGGSFPYLSDSDLADAIQSVKFTPIAFSLEELSKLWSVFLQTPYTLSVAFQGTAVLIDGLETPKTSLPVRASNLYVNPFRQPIIDRVSNLAGGDVPIDATSTLLISGKQLRGDLTQVRVGSNDLTPAQISNTEIRLDLSTVASSALRAGVQALQVVQPLLLGTPAVPHPGVESSAVPVTIVPIVATINASSVQGTGDELRSADLTLQLNPNMGIKQRVVLMLNEKVDNQPQAYTFIAPALSTDTDTVVIPVEGVKAGQYLVRVQVDGATSQLAFDTDTGTFTGPTVTIP